MEHRPRTWHPPIVAEKKSNERTGININLDRKFIINNQLRHSYGEVNR